MKSILTTVNFDEQLLCRRPCLIVPYGVQQAAFNRGILVYDGQIIGARFVSGVLSEVFVSPGTSVVFIGRQKENSGVKVTETSKNMGFSGIKSVPKTPKNGMIIKGISFGGKNELQSLVYGDKPMPMYQANVIKTSKEISMKALAEGVKMPKGASTKSLAEGSIPYIQLATGRYIGGAVASPNETMIVSGKNLQPDSDVVIYINNTPAAKGRVDSEGSLKAEVTAPPSFGHHTISVRQANSIDSIIDGMMFTVAPADGIENKKVKSPK
jgi:hypothetical protein